MVSIVIPVFNSEKYLPDCLNSILKQSYENFEVLLVEDGSTDGSAGVGRYYKGLDSRIKLIEQTNQGVSKARNAGLDMAAGKYLLFVDSDDWLETQALEKAVKRLEDNNADMVAFGYYEVKGDKTTEIKVTGECRTVGREQYIREIICDDHKWGGGLTWNKLWRTGAMEGYGRQRFDAELFSYEDKLWNVKAAAAVKKIVLIPECLYHYRIHGKSLSHNKSADLDKRENSVAAYKKILDYVKLNGVIGNCEEIEAQYYKKLMQYIYCCMVRKTDIGREMAEEFEDNYIKILRADTCGWDTKIKTVLVKVMCRFLTTEEKDEKW